MDKKQIRKIDCKQGEILLGSLLVYKVLGDEDDEGYEYCIIDLCEEKPYTRIVYEYSQKGLLITKRLWHNSQIKKPPQWAVKAC